SIADLVHQNSLGDLYIVTAAQCFMSQTTRTGGWDTPLCCSRSYQGSVWLCPPSYSRQEMTVFATQQGLQKKSGKSAVLTTCSVHPPPPQQVVPVESRYNQCVCDPSLTHEIRERRDWHQGHFSLFGGIKVRLETLFDIAGKKSVTAV